MSEIWKKLENTKYPVEVSSYGRIRRLPYTSKAIKKGIEVIVNFPEKFLIGPKLSTKGYPRVNIPGLGAKSVHRLVANAFIPNPHNLPQINHIDGNKLNNNIENLEWVSNQQNRDHAVAMNLHPNRSNGFGTSPQICEQIYKEYQTGSISQRKLGDKYDLCQQTISNIVIEIKKTKV